MISESGPSPWTSEDDTPTQVFGPLVMPDDTETGPARITDESAGASGDRDEHGLTALLTKDARSLVPPRTRERRAVKITAALGVVMLAVIAVATYKVVAGAGHAGKTTAAQSLAAHAATGSAAAGSAAASPASASTPARTTPSPSETVSTPPAAPDQTLRVTGATALGPGGKTGDDPQGAQNALTGHGPGWQTDWYLTPVFGGLQTGTGLLLDLGSARTISTVTVTLGGTPGANFELKAGDAASPNLPVVATSAGSGGTVRLTLTHPVQARYLLIWFTKLPPDGAGTYQVKVSRVSVRGHS